MFLRTVPVLLLLCALAPGADFDGDGVADTPLVMTDPDSDGCFGIAGRRAARRGPTRSSSSGRGTRARG